MKSVDEIANEFIQLYLSDTPNQKYLLYSKHHITRERPYQGEELIIKGLDNVIIHGNNFYKQFSSLHSKKVSNPVIGDRGFSLIIELDITDLFNKRKTIKELCIFIVDNGEIIESEFIY